MSVRKLLHHTSKSPFEKSCEADHAAQHELDHGDVDVGGGISRMPSESLLRRRDRPSQAKVLSTTQRFGSTSKPLVSADSLQAPGTEAREPLPKLVARVTAVGPDEPQPREASPEAHKDEHRPVAILDRGRMDRKAERQAEGVDPDVPFPPRHPLARIVTPRPPFSVVFTL